MGGRKMSSTAMLEGKPCLHPLFINGKGWNAGQVCDLHENGIAACLLALPEGFVGAECGAVLVAYLLEGCLRKIEMHYTAHGEKGFDRAGGAFDKDDVAGGGFVPRCDAVARDARFQRLFARVDAGEKGLGKNGEVEAGMWRGCGAVGTEDLEWIKVFHGDMCGGAPAGAGDLIRQLR